MVWFERISIPGLVLISFLPFVLSLSALDIPRLGQESTAQEGRGNNRSVMPLDVLGCTRVTLTETKSFFDPFKKGSPLG